MAQPSAREQLLLELINRARLDPPADFNAYITSYNPPTSSNADINNALTFFRVNGAVLLAQINALTPVAPVAWNSALADAATAHSQLMINNNQQGHQFPGEADLGVRTTAAGYSRFSSLGENVFAFTDSILQGHAGFMVDWGNSPTGIQTPPGHRVNILGAAFKEVGLSVLAESNPATAVGPLVVTQDFGARFGTGAFILGVAYNDLDGDRFYSEGEGRAELGIGFSRVGAVITTQTQGAGGYGQEVAAGNYVVRFSGAGLPIATEIALAVGQSNIKLDIVGTDTVLSSVSFELLSGATKAQLIGRQNGNITGNASANILLGNAGANILDGGAGIDTVHFQGARNSYSITTGTGVRTVADSVAGRDGTDTLSGIERLLFSDGTLAFDNSKDDAAGRGYLIYRAAFDRVPDAEGLGYWIRELDRGQDYGAVVAASFIASLEFITLNGANTSNAQFVNLLYQNVLHRAGEADGVAYWLKELDSGGARSNVLASFATSAENVTNIGPQINDGIFFV
jgi:uncharacterized protein YkwD